MAARWTVCNNLVITDASRWVTYTNLVAYSDHEFITGNSTCQKIEKYDTLTDEWITLFELPKIYRFTHRGFTDNWTAICLDSNKNKLYITFKSHHIGIFNMKTKTIDKFAIDVDLGNIPSLLLLNEELNIIGGHLSNKHFIWNNKTKKLEQKHIFSHANMGIVGHRIIYQVSKNRLIMFGGFDNGTYGRLDCIWIYYVNNDKWIESTQKLPVKMNTFGCIMTISEKYAVILGGIHDKISKNNRIFIVNLETMEISLSNVKCPEMGLYNAILMPTENERNFLLVNGYVKNICYYKKIFINIPKEIIELICIWYRTGYIHLISTKRSQSHMHWNIPIDKIFAVNINDN